MSRALERRHKTPLLGLASAFDAARADGEWWHEDWVDDVALWQHWFWGRAGGADARRGIRRTRRAGAGRRPVRHRRESVNAGPRAVPATHGAFDNDVDVVATTIRRMLGLPGDAAAVSGTDLDY